MHRCCVPPSAWRASKWNVVVSVWRHAKPPQSCWGVYFCKPCRLCLAITIMRKSLVACRATSPRLQVCLLTHAKSPSFSQVGGECAGTPCLSHRHHWAGRGAGQDMLGHMTQPQTASMPHKDAWVQTCVFKSTHAPYALKYLPIGQAEMLPPWGSLGPRASQSSVCSHQTGDRWECWHIPLTGDGCCSCLICTGCRKRRKNQRYEDADEC